MAFTVNITPQTGSAIKLTESAVESVEFFSDSPDDSQSRTDKISITIVIKGIISSTVDETLNIPQWALVKEDQNWSATVEVSVLGNDQSTIRTMKFTDAFLVSYEETFVSNDGNGSFVLVVKQNKEVNKDVTLDGGY